MSAGFRIRMDLLSVLRVEFNICPINSLLAEDTSTRSSTSTVTTSTRGATTTMTATITMTATATSTTTATTILVAVASEGFNPASRLSNAPATSKMRSSPQQHGVTGQGQLDDSVGGLVCWYVSHGRGGLPRTSPETMS